MYAPQLGRFLNTDPLVRDPTILVDNNWFGERLRAIRDSYGYCRNNPVNVTDPSGQDWQTDLAACIRAARDQYEQCIKREPEEKCMATLAADIARCIDKHRPPIPPPPPPPPPEPFRFPKWFRSLRPAFPVLPVIPIWPKIKCVLGEFDVA
ncbi:MAG: RHS repeat-associated core domain-containing protein [Thermomicrobiales bacterium]